MTECPFKVGDRVRYVGNSKTRKRRRGTVLRVDETWWITDRGRTDGFLISLRLDGGKGVYWIRWRASGAATRGTNEWEPSPLSDWTRDEVSQALAEAVLAKRDWDAVCRLADRVMELQNEGAK